MVYSHKGKVASCDLSLKFFWKLREMENNKEKQTYSTTVKTKIALWIQEDLEKPN